MLLLNKVICSRGWNIPQVLSYYCCSVVIVEQQISCTASKSFVLSLASTHNENIMICVFIYESTSGESSNKRNPLKCKSAKIGEKKVFTLLLCVLLLAPGRWRGITDDLPTDVLLTMLWAGKLLLSQNSTEKIPDKYKVSTLLYKTIANKSSLNKSVII